MSRRDNALVRCRRCHAHESLCFCALIPRIETRTRVVLIIHRFEDRKPTNTGRLAIECLPNSEVILRGDLARPSGAPSWDRDSQPLLLFPRDGATPIGQYARTDRPVTLIVPDGTWRQAARMRNRVPGLLDIPCVALPPDLPSAYRLRAETHVEGLATMEAVARALGILEGPHVRRAMELVFRAMVDRALWSRGKIATAAVTGGIPPGALRHDPRSGLRDP